MLKLTRLSQVLAVGALFIGTLVANAQNIAAFNFTGALQTWTVPCGIDSVIIDMAGAQGGNNGVDSGGLGGRVQCVYHTTAGTVFNIYVGSQGAPGASAAAGGYNGGGNAGVSTGGSTGSGGGGATDIRIGGTALANRVIVAGGGGGDNNDKPGPGNGGDTIGGDSPNIGNGCFATFATGGTQTAGGLDATTNGLCCTFAIVPDGSLG